MLVQLFVSDFLLVQHFIITISLFFLILLVVVVHVLFLIFVIGDRATSTGRIT
jgi:hypothetical protein